MKTLYIEPFSGLSGDMFLGALCGLCDDYETIRTLPERLNLPDGRVAVHEVEKNGIACRHVEVIDLNPPADAGTTRKGHHHGHGHGAHRHLSDIEALIAQGDLAESAKARALDIFRRIGEAESTVHDIPIEKIHFHEISAVDSIIDIVGCAVLLDRLGIERCFSDPVCTGFGMIDIAHGRVPVPAPATAILLQGMPVYKGDEAGERVTPTGAAILQHLAPVFDSPPMRIERTAYGPGRKDFKAANVLRLSLCHHLSPGNSPGNSSNPGAGETIEILESNIDDATPEELGSAFQEGLMAAGAVDFTLMQVLMKKGRPAITLQVLAPPGAADAVARYILEHTTSIGLRRFRATRDVLPREPLELQTSLGPVKAKHVRTPSGNSRIKVEAAEWERLAATHGLSVQAIKTRLAGELRPPS